MSRDLDEPSHGTADQYPCEGMVRYARMLVESEYDSRPPALWNWQIWPVYQDRENARPRGCTRRRQFLSHCVSS